MKSLIIYDNEGYLISITQSTENIRLPIGVPYIYTEIPIGKRVKIIDGVCVDVTTTPHQIMLEDLPFSLEEKNRADIDYIAIMTGVDL